MLIHDQLILSKWKINSINYRYYINSSVEKYDSITDDYTNTYAKLFYDCISDSVKHAISVDSKVGCVITNTIESRIMFETLKKYYSNNSDAKRFYVYYMSFEESANDPYYNYDLSTSADETAANTFIRTNIVIPSIYSKS